MTETSYYLLGEQSRTITAKDSMVGQPTDDLSGQKQYLLLDTTGDCTFFIQYSIDLGVTWNTYPDATGWTCDNGAKIVELNLSGILRGMVRNNSATATAEDTQMTLWTETGQYYCTVAEAFAQAFPGTDLEDIPSGVPTVDETEDFILDAQEEINLECQTAFIPTTVTEIQDGNGTQVLYPRNYPLISVASLTVNNVALTENTDFILYKSMKEGSMIAIKQGSGTMFYIGQQNVDLTYTYGFATVPRIARTCAAQLAAIKMLIAHMGSTRASIVSGVAGPVNFTRSEPTADLEKTLAKLNGTASEPGLYTHNLELLKKRMGYRVISYRPRWGWLG